MVRIATLAPPLPRYPPRKSRQIRTNTACEPGSLPRLTRCGVKLPVYASARRAGGLRIDQPGAVTDAAGRVHRATSGRVPASGRLVGGGVLLLGVGRLVRMTGHMLLRRIDRLADVVLVLFREFLRLVLQLIDLVHQTHDTRLLRAPRAERRGIQTTPRPPAGRDDRYLPARSTIARAQRKYLLRPRSPTVLMLKAFLSSSASAAETPCSASTGASTISASSLPSNALSMILEMSATVVPLFIGGCSRQTAAMA